MRLRPREFALLVYLIENKRLLLTREQIVTRVWGQEYEGEYRTVDTHVKRIREKMGEAAKCIHTIWGVGYKIEDD
ncbi:MAG: winged helix-turn-helix domain-containing protein [Paenibacillaceae bacterium]